MSSPTVPGPMTCVSASSLTPFPTFLSVTKAVFLRREYAPSFCCSSTLNSIENPPYPPGPTQAPSPRCLPSSHGEPTLHGHTWQVSLHRSHWGQDSPLAHCALGGWWGTWPSKAPLPVVTWEQQQGNGVCTPTPESRGRGYHYYFGKEGRCWQAN